MLSWEGTNGKEEGFSQVTRLAGHGGTGSSEQFRKLGIASAMDGLENSQRATALPHCRVEGPGFRSDLPPSKNQSFNSILNPWPCEGRHCRNNRWCQTCLRTCPSSTSGMSSAVTDSGRAHWTGQREVLPTLLWGLVFPLTCLIESTKPQKSEAPSSTEGSWSLSQLLCL